MVKCIGIHCVLARLITKQADLFTNGRGKWMYLQMIMAEMTPDLWLGSNLIATIRALPHYVVVNWLTGGHLIVSKCNEAVGYVIILHFYYNL